MPEALNFIARADCVSWQVQCAVLALLVTWAVLTPRWAAALHTRLMSSFARWGSRPARWVLLCGLLAGLASALVSILILWPQPSVHDEFSYLLAAETFASGRATNPPHPLWEHFETFHILQQPTYASKYPPAQGLVLALGLILTDDAAVSLWLQSAGMCAAFAWMLLGWLPARWAVLGSLIGVLQFGIAGYWAQSFWGGATAAMAGALMFGALPRIVKSSRVGFRVRVGDSLCLGVGLAGLANSRPYEGLIASLPVAVVLAWWMIRNRRRHRDLGLLSHLVLPLASVLALTAVLMGYYNWRVVGDPLVLPYLVHEQQYAPYPSFLWEPMRNVPGYRHEVMETFWRQEQAGDYDVDINPLSLACIACKRSWGMSWFYFGALLLVPLVAMPFAYRSGSPPNRRRNLTLALITCALVCFALTISNYCYPHYAAPITCLLVLLVIAGWRVLAGSSLWLLDRKRLRALSMGLLSGLVILTGIRAVNVPTEMSHFGQERAKGIEYLQQQKGRDLVIVHYNKGHLTHFEWVFNHADIDGSDIVWARDMGQERNRRLLDYFRDRVAWKLDVGPTTEWPKLERVERRRR